MAKDIYRGLSDEEMTAGFGDDDDVMEEPQTDQSEDDVDEEVEDTEVDEETVEVDDYDDDDDDEEEDEEAPKAEETAEDVRFTLKHFGESKDYSKEETVTLAQKGLDYDRIRQERDTLKTEKATLQEHEDFLKELADMSEMSVEDFMVEVKANVIVTEEKKMGRDITLDQAKYRVRSELKARKPKEEAKDPLEAKRQESFDRFEATYPDVLPSSIPKEVWDEFGDGSKKDLGEVYARYLLKQERAKNETLEQNARNKKRSTGSRHSNGSPAIDHDFDGWGEY